MSVLRYSSFEKDEAVLDTYHGLEVKDPYRYLEDPFDERTKSYVKAQNQLTDSYVGERESLADITKSLGTLTSFPSAHGHIKSPCGRWTYYLYNDSTFPQDIWKRTNGTTDEVFFDTNKLSKKEGVTVSAAWPEFSQTGKYWSVTLSRSGSDWQSVLVISTETTEPVEEELKGVKFTWNLQWLQDIGFVYKAPPPKDPKAPSLESFSRTLFHALGTNVSEDITLWENQAEPKWNTFLPTVTDDEKYLFTGIYRSTESVIKSVVRPINQNTGLVDLTEDWRDIHEPWEGSYRYICTTIEGTSLFATSLSSPSWRVVSTDLSVSPSVWSEVIPSNSKGAVLTGYYSIGSGLLLLVYSLEVQNRIFIYKTSGELIREVTEIPLGGQFKEFSRQKGSMEFSFGTESFITAGTTWRGLVDEKRGDVAFKKIAEAEIRGWNSDNFVQRQTFYKSKDSTKVPMFIAHAANIDLSVPQPTLLFGYGGFGWTQEPQWTPLFSAFISSYRGILAVASIRGGGEYGEEWHEAAIKHKKQNSYDDFIAAAEYLKHEKIASGIAIYGSSNGGLLCGAVINQRPDLFSAALPDVGVMDLLRFNQFTMGSLWTSEYGDPVIEEDFRHLKNVSPLHNIIQQQYPAVFTTTADADSRVIPGHTLKYNATMQELNPNNTKPILCRIYTDTGHGMGKSKNQVILENSEKLAFLAKTMGLTYYN